MQTPKCPPFAKNNDHIFVNKWIKFSDVNMNFIYFEFDSLIDPGLNMIKSLFFMF